MGHTYNLSSPPLPETLPNLLTAGTANLLDGFFGLRSFCWLFKQLQVFFYFIFFVHSRRSVDILSLCDFVILVGGVSRGGNILNFHACSSSSTSFVCSMALEKNGVSVLLLGAGISMNMYAVVQWERYTGDENQKGLRVLSLLC